jgi:hypothetical protein
MFASYLSASVLFLLFASDTMYRLHNGNFLPSLEEVSLVEEPLPRIENDSELTEEEDDDLATLNIRIW